MRMIAAIDALQPRVKRLWTNARDRVFDIGVAKAKGEKAFYLALHTETVRAISRIGARIAFSFYPPYYP